MNRTSTRPPALLSLACTTCQTVLAHRRPLRLDVTLTPGRPLCRLCVEDIHGALHNRQIVVVGR